MGRSDHLAAPANHFAGVRATLPRQVKALALRGAAVTVAACVALCGAAAASARPPELPRVVGGEHVLVHYDPATTSDAAAAAVRDEAEQAWALEVGSWGFAAPAADAGLGGDDRVDVYLAPFPGSGADAEGGLAQTDAENGNESGYLQLDPGSARPAFVAHELFHVIQFGYSTNEPPFVYESTAELAAANAFPGPDVSRPDFLAHPDWPLDCPGASCPGDPGGYGQWPFFEYVQERAGGTAAVRGIWEQLARYDDGGHTLEALAASLAAHGSSLAAAYNGYVRANLLPRRYKNPILHALGTRAPAATPVVLVARAGASGLLTAQLPHLSAQYFLVRSRCTGKRTKPLRLSLAVALPAGAGAVPSLRVGTTVRSLAVSGGTARTSVRFTPCTKVLLGLPNPSLQDGLAYRVSVSVA